VKLLELLAPLDRPLSQLADELPKPEIAHTAVHCPWGLKGTVMRVLNERFADQETDLLDGIKVFDERGWVQVLPDPDEPLVHVYAEGNGDGEARELESEVRALVEGIVQGETAEARTS
jgi:mannose-1-phosphate guanylyltransferase/phosphomannomutase